MVQPGGSIDAAITAAPSGGVVWVQPGTYQQAVAITKPITLQAAVEGGAVVIDGQCTRDYPITISTSDVTVRGFQVQNARRSTILVDSGSRTLVQNNRLLNFDCDNNGAENEAGVSFWYSGNGQRVIGNYINGKPSLADTAQASKQGNGVWFKSYTGSPSGGGHLVQSNEIRHTYDGIGGEVEDDPRGGFDRDSIIELNIIDDCQDDGISVEGGTRNVEVRHNTIRRCAIGIANAPNLGAGLTDETAFRVIDNDISLGRPGTYGNVQCFKIGNNGTGLAIYTGNRCVLPPGADGWARTNPGVNPMRIRNNYISVGRYVMELPSLVDVAGGKVTMDGDTLCTTDTTRFISWGGTKYLSLAAFRSATGQEQNGQSC